MDEPSTTPKRRRLNLRSLIILAAVTVVCAAGFFALKAYRDRRDTPALKVEAKRAWESKKYALALGRLNRYLELHPNDLDALDLKARFLAESARDVPQVEEAIALHRKILGRDNGRQETRHRLAELTLKVPGKAKTAATYARELIRLGDDGAGAHRLLARALEQSAAEGDDKALEEACREYEAAEARAPGDVEGGEQLARLYQEKLNDPEKALAILDRLLTLATESKVPARRAAVHLARSRYFTRIGRYDRAEAEVGLAIPDDPKNIQVRLAAAQLAAQRGDAGGARRQLAEIPEAARNDLRIKLVEGMIDYRERRPDDAIQSWRAGLVLTGGNDIELTWLLAQVLLDLGRVGEAEPLMAQYRRLIGGEEPNAWYRYLVALSLLKSNRPPDAIKELEAIQFKSDKHLEPALYLLLGQAHEANRDEVKALAAYRKATELAPEQADPWLATARLQWKSQPAAALDTVELGLKSVPAEPRLLAMLVNYQWRRQMQQPAKERSWTEVDRALKRAEALAPGSMEVALTRAEYLLGLGKPDDALALLEAAARRAPKVIPIWEIRARILNSLGRRADALKVLDDAIASAGPQGVFFVARASILLAEGHVKEAHATLKDALTRVPAEQQAALWKALGEYGTAQNDPVAARIAFGEYARLDPGNPEPRLLLLDLALATNDERAMHGAVESLKALRGTNSLFWRLARVQELLRERSPGQADPAGLEEAARLIKEIQNEAPQAPRGYLLAGRLHERRKETGVAAEAYEHAVDLGGGQPPLAALIALLVREHRDNDLERLRMKPTILPTEVDRLAALEALKIGDKDRAERLAARLAEGQPDALDVQVWQAQVLKDLGKPEAAEEALTRLTKQKPTQAAPWVQLLMLQVSRNRMKEAAETVEQIRTNVRVERPELLWAQCYRAAGNLPRAEDCFRDALKKWPDDPNVRAAAIGYCEQTGRQNEAESMLRKILERDPALGWASRKLALLRAGRRGDRTAWNDALRLIGPETRPDDTPDDRLTRASVYALGPEPRHRAEALKIVDQLAEDLPTAPAVHELAARLHLAEGDLAQARLHAALAASDGTNLDHLALYTRVLLKLKDYDAAERQLQRLESLAPNTLPVIELRALYLSTKGQVKEAGDLLERACDGRLNTIRDVPIAQKMIHLLLELGQPEAAARVARTTGKLGTRGKCVLAGFLAQRANGGPEKEAAALLRTAADAGDPRGASAEALAVALQPKADPSWLELADTLMDQARKAEPDAPELIERQALLRHQQRRFKDQIALYDELRKRQPPSYQFLNSMAWTLSEDMGDPQEGLRRADEALVKLGREPHLLDTRGVILTRLDRLDDAIADLEAAADALPTGPICFHLARAYQKKGRAEDFRRAVTRAKHARLVPEQLQPAEREEWAKEAAQ